MHHRNSQYLVPHFNHHHHHPVSILCFHPSNQANNQLNDLPNNPLFNLTGALLYNQKVDHHISLDVGQLISRIDAQQSSQRRNRYDILVASQSRDPRINRRVDPLQILPKYQRVVHPIRLLVSREFCHLCVRVGYLKLAHPSNRISRQRISELHVYLR